MEGRTPVAGKRKPQPTADNLSDTGTSSVQNRLAAEALRQADAREARKAEIKALKDAHKATAERLEAKPTDTRKISNAPKP